MTAAFPAGIRFLERFIQFSDEKAIQLFNEK